MHAPLNDAATRKRGSIRLDLLLAVALALFLSVGWAINDWARLSHMLLPDFDDMMRLAQVRDWLAGQGINDWTQYRMAPPHGSPMHWSRVNDAGIAGLILAATPFVGRAHAELFAILVYPGLLFACALFLSARIGRRLWGAAGGPVAAILTALAYPGTTVFTPGRIDHHALQVVLIQLLVLLVMRAPRWSNGIAAGLVTGVSLVVGLETAPQLALLIAMLSLLWVVRGMDERTRLAGFATALAASTLVFLLFLRPSFWTAGLCDAFTPASSSGTLAVSAALGILAAATPWLPGWRIRMAAGALLGGLALGGTLVAFPSCLDGPYGVMDPFLVRAFLPYIDEANSVFAQPHVSRMIAIGGMLAAASLAALWMLIRERRRWPVVLPIALVVLGSALITVMQVRGAYIGAPLGAPVLAGLVVAARERTRWRLPALVAAWLVSAGVAYQAIPGQIEQRLTHGKVRIGQPTPQMVCSSGDAWQQVDQFAPGVTMASTSVAAYLIGATHHSTVGAGYHRNNAGNMAMYRFFLSPPEQARAIGQQWHTGYVAFCPGDFTEIDVARNFPRSLAAALGRGETPEWLRPLPLHGTPLRFYRVVR